MSGYKTVMGIDKLPSYDSFSMVIITYGKLVLRDDAIKIASIVKMANLHKVDAIATE